MTNIEKIIKGLEHCSETNGNCQYTDHKDCPYLENCKKEDYSALCKDALKLLKEKFDKDIIVRCKDCNECYFASNRIPSEQTLVCGKHGIDISPDWFCADGKRK